MKPIVCAGFVLLLLVAGCGMPPGVSVEYEVYEHNATVCIVVAAEIPADHVSIETRPDGSIALCYTSPILMERQAKEAQP